MRLALFGLVAGLAAPIAAQAGMRDDELPRALPDDFALSTPCSAQPSLTVGTWRLGPAGGEPALPRGGEDRLPPLDERPLTAEPSAARLALHLALPATRQTGGGGDNAFVTFGLTAGASFDLGLRHRDAQGAPAVGADCGR
ncbi:MAG: hypothetical protein HQL40_01305 [Alphaproteobacteria bacterium]|nr:hypothetical protein [Alphaproteobacteria bacterium]